MKKPTHRNTTAPRSPSKMFDEILDIFTLKQKPISIDFVEQLGQQSVKSAMDKKNDLTLMGFFALLGYGSNDIKRWRERSDKFSALYEQRRLILANKRETGAALKDFDEDKKYARLNENFVRLSMPLYDPEWVENEKRIAALNKESEKPAIQYVVIPEFPKE